MKKNIVYALAKKEFFGFINSPMAYIITVPFLVISSFLYFRSALMLNEANLRPFFELLPWLFLLLVPALSMKLLTDERQQGTIELLFGHPILEAEIILAKFLGSLCFFVLILMTTFGLPITLLIFSKPDIGLLISQYLGAVFVGAAFLSIGLAVSTYVKNATASFLLAASISFCLILVGLDFFTIMLPWPINKIAQQLSITTHMNSLARGLLDLRDVLYFLTLTSLFLINSIIKLSTRKTAENKKIETRLNFIFFVILILGISLNVFMLKFPWRIDLTKQKLFTLSKGTKQTLKKLPEEVNLTLYVSKDLPAPIQPTLKQVEDLLKDYQRYGQKIKLETIYLGSSQEAAEQALENNIQEITFNQMSTGKFEVQTGFLGLTVKYKEKTESLPFIQSADDLEYQLTRRVRKLTSDKEKIIGFTNFTMGQNQYIKEALGTEYTIKDITLETEEEIEELSALIIIDDGLGEQATAAGILKNFLTNNGKALVLSDGINVNPQVLSTTKSKSKILETLSEYGITVNKDLVYDLQLNETISLGQGGLRYFLPYPFWLKSLVVNDNLPSLKGIESVTLSWPSSLKLEQKENISLNKILETSKNAGQQKDNFTLAPQEVRSLTWKQSENIPLGATAERGEARLAVIASSSLIEDQFIQNSPSNLALAINLVDWLAMDKALASIPHKSGINNPFQFTNPNQPAMVQYGNIAVPPILIILFAAYWLRRRKNLTLRKYLTTSI